MSRPGRSTLSLQVELVIWSEIQVFAEALYLSKRCIRFRADQVMEALAKLERKAIS